MNKEELSPDYWQKRYSEGSNGWDLGDVSTPLKNYFDQLYFKECKILIPGGGNGYEAEYLFKHGFKNVFLLDYANLPLIQFQKRNPEFPSTQLICENFFDHKGQYDLIVEQTFFCALHPSLRNKYATQMHSLLKPNVSPVEGGGKVAGLLFNDPMADRIPPPYGGIKEEYLSYFNPLFNIKAMEICYNSILPRKDKELFMILERK